ncbi:MAG: hypothetical protein JXR05_02260 [Flavobacteriaceae bacterium]
MKKIYFLFLFIYICNSNAQVSDFNHIDFSKADKIASNYKNEELTNLPLLAHKLTSNLTTDVEKFRALYMWVCTNIKGDYSMFLKNKRKRGKYRNDSIKLSNWNKSIRKKMFKQLRRDKKTVCTGYAYLIKELARLANIKCIIIDGFGRTSSTDVERLSAPNHSWNAVLLNGKWYLCDATWASGMNDLESNTFKFDFKKGYFLAEPKLFAKNHFPLERRWMLTNKNGLTFNAFLEGPVIYSEAFKYISSPNYPKKMLNTVYKKEKATFKYKLLSPIDPSKISLLISNGITDKIVKPTVIIQQGNSLAFEYQFPKRGFYDVHVIAYNDVLMTYTFDVKNK